MEVAERSSSVDLSSVPGSDSEPPAAFANLSNNIPSSTPSSHNPYLGPTSSGVRQDPAPAKQPRKPARPRKPKTESDAAKPARKPRGSNGTTTNSRKKPKLEASEDKTVIQTAPSNTGLQSSRLVEPYFTTNQSGHTAQSHEAAKLSQNGFSNNSPSMQPSHMSYQAPPQITQTPPRVTSMYDPIRGAMINQEPTQSTSSHVLHTPPHPVSRSGASPISSLIDPPAPVASVAPSPLRTFTTPSEPQQAQTNSERQSPPQPAIIAMDVDGASETASRKQSISKKASEPPTRAGSPKPARAKEQPPPLPSGRGLLSATVFGGELSLADKGTTAATGPNIVLHIDLKDPKNKVINFARMAEEKYGFAALYPRQAAQKERLARVAAAGAALERSASGSKFNSAGESGDDDGSVDIDRDTDNDGDVAMGGMNGTGEGNSGTDAEPKKKKRRKKVEEYDLDDDFVDDSEQVWEAQAATTKEGFFVYCGPLVPEGEKATIERYDSISHFYNIILTICHRADGTVKNARGGNRGGGRRGGGPGSRGGRGARATAAARDSNAASNADDRPKTGPGSRGGKVTNRRKPAAKPAATATADDQQQQSRTESAPPTTETKQLPVPMQA